jgi:hypothetical protein
MESEDSGDAVRDFSADAAKGESDAVRFWLFTNPEGEADAERKPPDTPPATAAATAAARRAASAAAFSFPFCLSFPFVGWTLAPPNKSFPAPATNEVRDKLASTRLKSFSSSVTAGGLCRFAPESPASGDALDAVNAAAAARICRAGAEW